MCDMNISDYITVFITASSLDESKRIGKSLVEERLAACVNIITQVQSIFRWKGKICDEQEAFMIIKTRSDLFDTLRLRVKELHSYEVPEIIALPIIKGSEAYLKWIGDETICH